MKKKSIVFPLCLEANKFYFLCPMVLFLLEICFWIACKKCKAEGISFGKYTFLYLVWNMQFAKNIRWLSLWSAQEVLVHSLHTVN